MLWSQLLQQRLAAGRARGEGGVLLDGFPRTRSQADSLLRFSDVQLALNLHLREEVCAVLHLVVWAACRHLGRSCLKLTWQTLSRQGAGRESEPRCAGVDREVPGQEAV